MTSIVMMKQLGISYELTEELVVFKQMVLSTDVDGSLQSRINCGNDILRASGNSIGPEHAGTCRITCIKHKKRGLKGCM